MFRKKETSTKPANRLSKSQSSGLALLIADMQKNADQVEKDILRSEDLLAVDAENDKKDLPLQHQAEISEKLGQAELLLKTLFINVDQAKKLKHPQATEIESDVIHLHDRWLQDCTFYRDVYEQIDDVSMMPKINWGPVFNKKQKQVNSEEFGPTMADVEKQIAAHNIQHKEIEAYNSQLCVSSAGGKDEYTALKKQYNNLLDNSKWRRHYLNSLYEYMHGCQKELSFLAEEQDKIKKQDWSDRMVDPPDTRRQYENFKNNSLLSHESEVNKLQEEGDRLIELKHPASATIQAQRDTVRGEWQKFLNLCICQETHLDNVEEYKRYQMNTERLSETLTKLNNNLDPKSVSAKSNSEMLLQLEAEDKAVDDSERLLADLRKRCITIAPLKLRRTNINRPITVESLCDWETDKESLSRGQKLSLKSNSDPENWDVICPDGSTQSFPGVCFQIPPPDPAAIDKVDLLGNELADLKRRRAALEASLKNRKAETSKAQKSAPVSSAAPDPKVAALAQQLEMLDADLAKEEENMLSRLRCPLSRTDPAADLASRLKEQEKAAQQLKALEQQKQAAQANLQPLLANTTSSALPLQLSAAKNKQDGIAALADLYTKKANASLNLEGQIKKVDGLVSGFEKNLSKDGAIPDVPYAIKSHAADIQDQQRAVAAAKGDMKKLGQDLETTEQLCSSLQQSYQEYCPDVNRQKREVQQLQTRYENVANQLNERDRILQEAAIKNQEFESTCKSVNSFLECLPTNTVNSTDDLSKVAAKKSSQERVMDDLRRKGDDMDRVTDLSHDLQNLLNEYETNVDKYNGTLEDAGKTVPDKLDLFSLSDSIQRKEKDLTHRFSEATAENAQRQKQMDLAQNLILQNEEKVQLVAQQQVQLQNQQRSSLELEGLMKELGEEKERTTYAQNDLETFKQRMLSLKNRKGTERFEETEVLQFYRDPKLEHDLMDFQRKLDEETLRHRTAQTEVEGLNNKISIVEENIKKTPPKLVTREVTEYERDPQLDLEAAKIRNEISRLKDEIRVRDGEQVQMRTEVSILQKKPPNIKEKVVKKEVVKVEKDPGMLRAVETVGLEISGEGNKIKLLNDQIFQTRSEINALETLIPSIMPKIITKEVRKVEQDPKLIIESQTINKGLEEEAIENNNLSQELSMLQSRYRDIQLQKPKIEVKEIVNEIFRIDPNTELEIMRTRKEIQDLNKKNSDLERETNRVTTELSIRRAEKPKVEMKEVLQEVVKEERSPENEREIQRLNDQLSHLRTSYNNCLAQVGVKRQERDELKAEKSKVETQILTREVVRYEADPLLEKEADRLRRDVREEAQTRRKVEEMVFDLKNKFILLERQRPEEKVVLQEVVRLQKDPKQIIEHEQLSRNLDQEIKDRRKVGLDVQQLRALLEDKERALRESEEHQKRIQAESELRELRLRITQLENAPPPIEESIIVEEVLKVEKDPKLERLTNGLRSETDQQSNEILRLQRDIRNINHRLEILQKEKSHEKTVYKEVVRVEKDQAVEAERERLRELVSQQKFGRQDLEDEIRRLSDKINFLMSNKASSSREETTLNFNKDTLQRERDDLARELRQLEAKRHETSLSFQQQSKLMSERSQINRQRSLKMESEVQRLERDILSEKDAIHQRDCTIREIQQHLQKEDQAEKRTKETNVSTKISILDPETGKDMSPYDAYLQGLIDRQQYINLQELECDWEEITSMGPDGETSVLQDRKSGKQYSIKEALKSGRLTDFHLQQYKQGRIPISEFALLVAGDNKKEPQLNSVAPKVATTAKSAPPYSPKAKELYPVAGVVDTNTDTYFTIRSAGMRKLIDPITAQKLLEAQASTGGIMDINNRERYTVHKAAMRGLIDDSQLQRLLNAQKAFSGVEDPVTRERLSVGEAILKGWMPKDTGIRYMEQQHLTGGLVDPKTGRRVNIMDAIGSGMVNSTLVRELQSESLYIKDITDPITKEKISYKQALERCKTDPDSGLPMLPASSKDSGYQSRYARF